MKEKEMSFETDVLRHKVIETIRKVTDVVTTNNLNVDKVKADFNVYSFMLFGAQQCFMCENNTTLRGS